MKKGETRSTGWEACINCYQHIDSFTQAVRYVGDFVGPFTGLTVLEAGCGSATHLDISGGNIVGIDISQAQLDKNITIQKKVLGDVQDYDCEEWKEAFDRVVCWDVVEHLKNPRIVIQKLINWTKRGGIVILAFPNAQSLKGVVTKYTPLAFHRFAKRLARPQSTRTFHMENTFRTYMQKDMRLGNIVRQISERHYTVPLMVSYQTAESIFYKRHFGAKLFDAVNSFLLGDLRGFINRGSDGLILVIHK